MSARFQLKAATQPLHDALDAHFSAYDLSDRADYSAFLRAHAAAYIPIEEALDRAGAGALFADWPAMRRGPELLTDLSDLGISPPVPQTAPIYEGDADIVGGLYVIEGSRLGGQFLKRSVGEDFPRRFLTHVAPKKWSEFVADFERILDTDVSRTRAGVSAAATFELFLRTAGMPGTGGHERHERRL